MILFVVAIVSFVASLLTFFSGFGLGTILLPVFSIIAPVPTAVSGTAVVHFSNNLFKLALLFRRAHWKTVLYFGGASVAFAALGALLLKELSSAAPLFEYALFDTTHIQVKPVSVVIGVLMICFAIIEWHSYFRSVSLSRKWLPVGGAISGFFGGLSGHQGALRSIFLLRLNLDKEAFLATGVVIAVFVDVVRLCIYFVSFQFAFENSEMQMIAVAIVAALAGALIGKYFLKSIQLNWMRTLVCALLVAIGTLVSVGLL